MTLRRWLVAGILLLSALQSLMLLWAAFLNWALRDFMTGNNPQVVADNTRIAIALFGWFGVNLLGLVVNVRGRWVLTAIQAANLTLALALAFVQVSDSCGYHGFEWFWLSGLAALTLVLQYTLWRRVQRSRPSTTSKPVRAALISLAATAVLMVVGAALVGSSWRLGFDGTQAFSGTVLAARQDASILYVTIDSSPREYVFTDIMFEPLPDVRAGDNVVLLVATSQSCGRYSTVAIQSQRGLWINSIYGHDQADPFTPRTWVVHEAIRWLALLAGFIITALGFLRLVRWIG